MHMKETTNPPEIGRQGVLERLTNVMERLDEALGLWNKGLSQPSRFVVRKLCTTRAWAGTPMEELRIFWSVVLSQLGGP